MLSILNNNKCTCKNKIINSNMVTTKHIFAVLDFGPNNTTLTDGKLSI